MFNFHYLTPQRCDFCPYTYSTTKEGTQHTLRYHQVELQCTPQGRALIRHGIICILIGALVLGGLCAMAYTLFFG